MHRDKYTIGTISSGTHRLEDLIPTLACELESLAANNGRAAEFAPLVVESAVIADALDGAKNIAGRDWSQTDLDASGMMESLMNALDEFAPPYFYFGTHPGDGADFGFWLSEFFSDEFEGLKVDDLAAIPNDYEGEAIVINDHGNMSLYTVRKGEKITAVWSIV